MNPRQKPPLHVAIACGGTGGHLFPGIAVANQLVLQGWQPLLLISPKEVDQQVVKGLAGVEIATLPAIGLNRGSEFAFLRGFIRSYWMAASLFKKLRPQAALAMGGFTSAPPILAAKRVGARTFIHESNAVPGRANRWLARVVQRTFVGFPTTVGLFGNRNVAHTGTPVRACFQIREAGNCRAQLGLDPARPVVLVMGGSQGASGINELVIRTLPLFASRAPHLQWLHLTGPHDLKKVRQGYMASKFKAIVHPFFAEMELALGAATAAVSRAGASSLAELAAVRVPAVLVPYPAATDNHQFHNARAFESTGAARLLEQKNATPETLVQMLTELIQKPLVHDQMRHALARWHAPRAAEHIAAMIVTAGAGAGKGSSAESPRAEIPVRRAADTGDNSMPARLSPAGRRPIRDLAGCTAAPAAGRGV
jgi:UDP-N-acetylglucosamine--N-acetylmuramyl-(pentapeptide) pyrophosphoryl-undecaprenol N-acetylglucosamine transferase